MTRTEYDKLRHTCGYTGANEKRFDPNCPKCSAKVELELAEELAKEIEERFEQPLRKPSLDDYDKGRF